MPRVRPRLDRRIEEQVGARFSLRWSKRELVLCCYEQLESDQGHQFVVIAFGGREIRNVDTKMAQHPLNLSRQALRAVQIVKALALCCQTGRDRAPRDGRAKEIV